MTICTPPKQVAYWVWQVVLSMKMVDFVDRKLFLRLLSIKKAVFLAGKVFSRSASKISGVFLAGKVADKKRLHRKNVSVTVW